MTELEEFSNLLHALYDAALDDARWQGVGRKIADAFDTHSCSIQVRTRGVPTVLATTDNITPAMLQEYAVHYHTVDLWSNDALRKRDTVYLGSDLVANSVVSRSEHSEFFAKGNIFYVIGGGVSVGADEVGLIGVHHDKKAGDFSERDRHKMALLLPHLQRALRMRSLFTQRAIERDMALSALDSLTTPVMLTDESAKVLYANLAAVSMLRGDVGLIERDGRLRTEVNETTQTLLHMIREASALVVRRQRAPRALVLQRSQGAPLSVLVAPVRANDLDAVRDVPMAMLLVGGTERRDACRPEILQVLFGLTPAESRLASELADGSSLEEFALRKGISMNTARTQLKSVLHKTGTQRQGEMIALVLKSAVNVA